jgi:hypothetical protein
MAAIPKISLFPVETLEALRRSVENAINSLIDRINNTKVPQLDAMGQRLLNVAKPASRTDAVPLGYLEDRLSGLSGAGSGRLDITTTQNTTSITLSDEIIITKV